MTLNSVDHFTRNHTIYTRYSIFEMRTNVRFSCDEWEGPNPLSQTSQAPPTPLLMSIRIQKSCEVFFI